MNTPAAPTPPAGQPQPRPGIGVLHAGWLARWQLRRTAGSDRHQPGALALALAGLVRMAGPLPGPVAVSSPGRQGLWIGLRQQGVHEVDILVSPRVSEADAQHWLHALAGRITPQDTGFELLRGGPALPAGLPSDGMPLADEVALDFQTPLPQALCWPSGRIDAPRLLQAMNQRIETWTGQPTALPHTLLHVNDALWHFDSVEARSRNHRPGSQPRLAGYRGPLLLRGVPPALKPWLLLLQRIQLDNSPVATGGSFRLQSPAPPWFQPLLADPMAWARSADWTLSHTDADPVLDEQGTVQGALSLGEQLSQEISHGRWQPAPSRAFLLPKPDGGTRMVERLSTRDGIVHRHLLGVLSQVFAHASSDAAHGARPGRGRDTALQALRDARRDGFAHVLRADVQNCFAQIDAQQALQALDPWLPQADLALRLALERAVTSRLVPPAGGAPQPREGLAQGSPLSPALANLVLSLVDRALDPDTVRLVRFADDLAVCCCSRESVERAHARLAGALATLGLQLNPAKTRVLGPDEPVDFLGETVAVGADDDLDAALAQRKPLLVAEPYAALFTHGEAVDVRHKGELVLTVPLRRVSEIVIVQRATLSTTLISRCAAQGIPVTIALDSGRRTATFAPESRRWFDVARQQGNRHAALSDSARLSVATTIVEAKLNNQLAWLKRRPTADEWPLIETLARCRVMASAAGGLPELRGHEGTAARLMFGALQDRIHANHRAAFSAPCRARGTPDRLNATLNFGYHALATRLYALLRSQGLDPHLGFLHDAQEDYGTLVWDAIEPFRVHVDRTLVRLVNRRQLTEGHFCDSPHGPRLGAEGKRVLFAGLEETWNSRIGRWLLRDLMVAQMKALRDWALGQGPLWWHRWQQGAEADPPPRAAAAVGDPTEGPA